ncbi:LysR family transcriptional regulator [Nonomuraea candida]|uniref:LysR family transcriptional regulator n=1 Tax=Nonomuraea candida TaxID=359159 RepID=UPI0005B9B41A|nr:LysR family transcriptional regulator [Nonomuraea candida]
MEIFHLRYFVAVAEHLSFSAAARGLHMATSPLSRRVRDLEGELGVRLFDRDPHHVELTEAGAALLPIAKDVLARFDDLPWRLRQAVQEGRPTVYVGVPPVLHPRLRERLAVLERRAAHLCELKRWPGGSADLLAGVQRGEQVAALVHLPVGAEGIEVREVLREPLGAVLPAAAFAGRASVSLRELTGYAYVTPRGLPPYFEQLAVRLKSAGIRRRIILETADYASTSEMVANGAAFSISFLDAASPLGRLRPENVVTVPFEDFRPELTTGLIWRADRVDRPELAELLRLAQEVLPDPAA